VRARSNHDEAVPAGASLACSALLYVGTATGNVRFVEMVEKVLARHAPELAHRPTAYSTLTLVLDSVVRGVPMVVVSGSKDDPLLKAARRLADPSVMVVSTEDGVHAEYLTGKTGKPGAYVCANQTCQAPVLDEAALSDALSRSGLLASVAKPR